VLMGLITLVLLVQLRGAGAAAGRLPLP
jgi:hypothetical protein